MWLSSQVQLCSAPQDLVYCRPSHILCGWDQGLASDLDIFSAPLSRGFFGCICTLVKTGGSQFSQNCIHAFFTLRYLSCNQEVFLQCLSFGTFFGGIELKIGPLPGNSPLSIGFATAIRAIGLYTQSLFTCHKRQSSII